MVKGRLPEEVDLLVVHLVVYPCEVVRDFIVGHPVTEIVLLLTLVHLVLVFEHFFPSVC